MHPLYTPENTSAAYQLNWSVAVFGQAELPPADLWLPNLQSATEADNVRILEHHHPSPNVVQFLISTRPQSTPTQIVRSLKGRWQYLLREYCPKLFRRNYGITSVGEANNRVLEQYVALQPDRHRMADPQVQQQIEALQFHDPAIDLVAVRIGTYGRCLHNLHVVVETESGWHDIRRDVLLRSRQMIIDCSARHAWRLARIGILSNHIHILLNADVTESPESIALSLMNNLAYVQQMKPVLRFSYYVGTFGPYDRGAVRNSL